MSLPDIFSEEHIRKHCPHCDSASDAFADLLKETAHFRIVCDHHPLIEGHILIIPKEHFSCLGEYPENVFQEFMELYVAISAFVRNQYGSVSIFEHGNIGQTVFHSHIHFLPFAGDPRMIIPEGMEHCVPVAALDELRTIYQRFHRYLYFSIGDHSWVVDPSLATPRFFRDRFAIAFGKPERGNWKDMHTNVRLMTIAQKDNTNVKRLWKKWICKSIA